MKKRNLLAILLVAGSLFTANAQNVVSNLSLTSGGAGAGDDGGGCAYYGTSAGANSTGNWNTFVGYVAGMWNTTGTYNTSIGANAAGGMSTGSHNISIGYTANNSVYSGSYNVSIGDYSGSSNISQSSKSRNTSIGYQSGYATSGSGNIFIGYTAGYQASGSNLLYIDNTSTNTPLIWGNFSSNQVKLNGKVGIGIGTANFPTSAGSIDVSAYNLVVSGGILTEEVRVNLQNGWADYVFDTDYKLPSLNDVEQFIKNKGHLPNMPSASEVEENGIELGEIAVKQQEKIEELTLYTINQEKKIDELSSQINQQKKEIEELKAMVKTLIDKK